jgi:glutathione synthase
VIFSSAWQDIVVKPLDGMGGSGVFRLTERDPNIGAILETITQLEQRTVMAQRYLPAIAQGDKRIIGDSRRRPCPMHWRASPKQAKHVAI